MADMFQAKGSVAGVFKGTTVSLQLNSSDGGGSKGALVQSVQLTYTRNVTRVWELGSRDTYYVVGHPEGTCQLTRIVTKADNDFLDQLADVCDNKDKSKTLVLTGTGTSCEGDSTFTLKMGGPVLTQRSFAIAADQFLISSTAALMFASLEKA